ncbi:hypothetical protein C8J55DRAFT_493678 [Lentinula edodes]|uniref:Uncharacterized protein n=1 Tax=Lentinula lateritia TaxID=40482 RepID=A0A9W9DE86_9AGAR|nr:hypothetical protein C8J55DRAFT_493678 [Lentinula edodes]
MSDKDALFYLKQCKVPARWTLASEFRAMPDSAQNIRNSDGDWTQFKEMSKVDELIESLQSKMLTIKPMVPMLVEAYYNIVRGEEMIPLLFIIEYEEIWQLIIARLGRRSLRKEVVEKDSIEEDWVQEKEESDTSAHIRINVDNGSCDPGN